MNCACVGKHIPLPMISYHIKLNGKIIDLCPTSYFNLQLLVSEYQMENGEPPGAIKKHYSSYIQQLASELWVDKMGGG